MLPAPPSGREPGAGVERSPSRPGTRDPCPLIKTTVLTGHVPHCLLKSPLPGGGSLCGGLWCLPCALPSLDCRLQLGVCAAGFPDRLVSARTAGLQQGFPQCQEPIGPLCGVSAALSLRHRGVTSQAVLRVTGFQETRAG